MAENMKQSPDGEYPWMGKVQRYIAYGQKGRAHRLLEKSIEYDMPLFYCLSDVQEDRRLGLVYLRHHGQMGNSVGIGDVPRIYGLQSANYLIPG